MSRAMEHEQNVINDEFTVLKIPFRYVRSQKFTKRTRTNSFKAYLLIDT